MIAAMDGASTAELAAELGLADDGVPVNRARRARPAALALRR